MMVFWLNFFVVFLMISFHLFFFSSWFSSMVLELGQSKFSLVLAPQLALVHCILVQLGRCILEQLVQLGRCILEQLVQLGRCILEQLVQLASRRCFCIHLVGLSIPLCVHVPFQLQCRR